MNHRHKTILCKRVYIQNTLSRFGQQPACRYCTFVKLPHLAQVLHVNNVGSQLQCVPNKQSRTWHKQIAAQLSTQHCLRADQDHQIMMHAEVHRATTMQSTSAMMHASLAVPFSTHPWPITGMPPLMYMLRNKRIIQIINQNTSSCNTTLLVRRPVCTNSCQLVNTSQTPSSQLYARMLHENAGCEQNLACATVLCNADKPLMQIFC